nr:hypothetical protein [Methylobacterium sp. L1A1]
MLEPLHPLALAAAIPATIDIVGAHPALPGEKPENHHEQAEDEDRPQHRDGPRECEADHRGEKQLKSERDRELRFEQDEQRRTGAEASPYRAEDPTLQARS